jgi:outer membrane protein TolC
MIRLDRTGAVLALAAVMLSAAGSVAAVDLDTALREIAAANPTLAARAAMAEAARGREGPPGAWPAPLLELSVENVPTSGGFDSDPMTMKVLGLTQRLPVFGRTGLGRDAARADTRAEDAAVQTTALELLGAGWQAYADAYFAGALRRQAEDHRGLMDRTVEVARARYQSGQGRLDEILRADADRSRLLADIASFGAEEIGARARLGALRGREPDAMTDTLAPPPPPERLGEAAEWMAAVSDDHPRLRELHARAEGDRLAARSARRSVWPDLELHGAYQWRATLRGGIPQDDLWSASVALSLPIFAGQSELAEAGARDAMAHATESERIAAALELKAAVTSAYAAAHAAQRNVHLLADTVLVAGRRALEASWSAYVSGQLDLPRLLETEHDLYGEEIAWVRACQGLAGAEARLVALTGRSDLLGVTPPTIRDHRP